MVLWSVDVEFSIASVVDSTAIVASLVLKVRTSPYPVPAPVMAYALYYTVVSASMPVIFIWKGFSVAICL